MTKKQRPVASSQYSDREKELSHLPKGWMWSTVGQLYKIVGGGTPSTTVEAYWTGDIPWITSADIHGVKDIRPRKVVNQNAIKNSATNLVSKGSILVVTRVGLGKVALTETPLCFSQDTQALSISDSLLNPKYSLYYLSRAVQIFKYDNRGTTISGVTKQQLSNLPFPLPPLAEQHRIVAKIEELFSSLDKGIENLKTAQQHLKIYRPAVLKWAFEGKLTNENVVDGELPDGWTEKKVSEIADTFGGCAFKSGEFKQKGKYQVLRMGNIRSGVLRYEEKAVFLNDVEEIVLNKALLRQNDVVITQTGTKGKRDYGFTALIPKTNLLLNQRIAAIRCNERCLPKFFLYYTWTDRFRNQYFENETGNVGQSNVGMKAVTDTLVYLPNIEEQHTIVAEIESRLSVCDKIEDSIDQSLKQAESLRQSILKKAFEGKLVPQNPNDEPASVLLDRIKAEREKTQAETPQTRQPRKRPMKTTPSPLRGEGRG